MGRGPSAVTSSSEATAPPAPLAGTHAPSLLCLTLTLTPYNRATRPKHRPRLLLRPPCRVLTVRVFLALVSLLLAAAARLDSSGTTTMGVAAQPNASPSSDSNRREEKERRSGGRPTYHPFPCQGSAAAGTTEWPAAAKACRCRGGAARELHGGRSASEQRDTASSIVHTGVTAWLGPGVCGEHADIARRDPIDERAR